MAIEVHTPAEASSALDRMSYEDYLRWAGEDNILAEWADGRVIIPMPPTDIHQLTAGFLYHLLDLFVHLLQLGRVFIAPFEMKLSQSAREPDILFVATEHLDRQTRERLVGPADLVIEIVSDDSVQRDRREKFREYRDAGIREYWIIDPRPGKQRADFYRLTPDADFELYATEDDERVASGVLPGFWLRPAWLWQAETLDPFVAFGAMAGFTEDFAQQLRNQIKGGFTKPQA